MIIDLMEKKVRDVMKSDRKIFTVMEGEFVVGTVELAAESAREEEDLRGKRDESDEIPLRNSINFSKSLICVRI